MISGQSMKAENRYQDSFNYRAHEFMPKNCARAEMKPIRRTRSDTSQKPIIEAIEKAGWLVKVIGWPCDLLCWKASKGFRTLECKSKRKKDGTAVLDKRQKEQAEFCSHTGTPYVTTPEEAIEALEQ